jgi:hypothetical protein
MGGVFELAGKICYRSLVSIISSYQNCGGVSNSYVLNFLPLIRISNYVMLIFWSLISMVSYFMLNFLLLISIEFMLLVIWL